ncbi:MAG: hypothetical protein D6826_03820 [Alphaproteobacteria bacterium]|nr:MAG: hypothetical protein D6826_03820 [Alphaproteobacteria bacterium]
MNAIAPSDVAAPSNPVRAPLLQPALPPAGAVPSDLPALPGASPAGPDGSLGKSDEPGSQTATPVVVPSIPRPRIGGIEVNPLAEVSPDAIGVLGPQDGGFGLDMWDGTPRLVVASLLSRLPDDLRSRTLRDLARRLLLSAATPPVSEAAIAEEAPPAALLSLRIERLAALGEVEALNRLLAAVPARHERGAVTRIRLDGLLLAGQSDDACRLVRSRIAERHTDVYWQQALVYCQLVAGATDMAMLGLDILRDQEAGNRTAQEQDDEALFFALADRMLGLDVPVPDVPAGALSPLHLVMFRASGTPIPRRGLDDAPPGLLFAIARAPDIEPEVRVVAAEEACLRGLIDGAALGAVYEALSFPADVLADPLGAAQTIAGARGRALLYQAARRETHPATRAEVLRVALEQAEADGLYQAVMPALLPLITEIAPVPQLAWFAATAGRALYAAGQYERAGAWLMLGRQEAIVNPQATAAVTALWPYARLAGSGGSAANADLTAWWAMRAGMGRPAATRVQALLRATFQALGESDPLRWSVIAANGEPVAQAAPGAAFIYALREASDARRRGETVLLSLVVMGRDGPGASHILALETTLAALVRIGLVDEARALAIEAALANGV